MLKSLTIQQYELAEYMSALSEEAYHAGWMDDLEYALWEVVIGERRSYGRLQFTTPDGLASVDKLHWDAHNESQDLIGQINAYKARTGYYPQEVIADHIYATRTNRQFMTEHGIQYHGKPLGRPRKATADNAEELEQQATRRKQAHLERIPVEGKFGQGKRGYRLNQIRAKRADTSLSWINAIFLVMNLLVLQHFLRLVRGVRGIVMAWLAVVRGFQAQWPPIWRAVSVSGHALERMPGMPRLSF